MESIILAAVLGALVPVAVSLSLSVPAEVDNHDRQIRERDELLEEWIVEHHRKLKQRFGEIVEQANVRGVLRGGTVPAGKTAERTLLLYDYRRELREARAFVLEVEVSERRPHRWYRRLRGKPIARLENPDRAEDIVEYWNKGTAGNALTWGIADIARELREGGE